MSQIYADFFGIALISLVCDEAERRCRSAAVSAAGALRIANALNEGASGKRSTKKFPSCGGVAGEA
jgi:hypothetical protein